MMARCQRDGSLEPRFVDLNVPACSGDDLVPVDQECFCCISADRNFARDGDDCPIEDAARDLDPARVLLVQITPAAKVEQPGFEAALLFGEGPATGRQLKIV